MSGGGFCKRYENSRSDSGMSLQGFFFFVFLVRQYQPQLFWFHTLCFWLPKVTTKPLLLRRDRKSNHCSLWPASAGSRCLISGICCDARFLLAAVDKKVLLFLFFLVAERSVTRKRLKHLQLLEVSDLSTDEPGGFLLSHPSCLCADWAWSGRHLQTVTVFAQVKERHMDGVRSVECYWRIIRFNRFIHRCSVFFLDANHLCRYQTLSAPLSDEESESEAVIVKSTTKLKQPRSGVTPNPNK